MFRLYNPVPAIADSLSCPRKASYRNAKSPPTRVKRSEGVSATRRSVREREESERAFSVENVRVEDQGPRDEGSKLPALMNFLWAVARPVIIVDKFSSGPV